MAPTIPRSGGLVKGETQMTRVSGLLARAIVLALLLLTIGGSIANADTTGTPTLTPGTALPDDPGYDPGP